MKFEPQPPAVWALVSWDGVEVATTLVEWHAVYNNEWEACLRPLVRHSDGQDPCSPIAECWHAFGRRARPGRLTVRRGRVHHAHGGLACTGNRCRSVH